MELGIDDPEQWLEDAPKRIVDLWDEYWKLEPWGLPWHQSAMSNTLLDWLLSYQVSSNGGDRKPKSFSDFMPVGFSEDNPTKKTSNLMAKLDRLSKRADKATAYYGNDNQ